MLEVDDLKRMIRDIPDFPKKGVIFKDITTLLSNAKAFATAIDLIGDRYIDKKVDLVVAAEAREVVDGDLYCLYDLAAEGAIVKRVRKTNVEAEFLRGIRQPGQEGPPDDDLESRRAGRGPGVQHDRPGDLELDKV